MNATPFDQAAKVLEEEAKSLESLNDDSRDLDAEVSGMQHVPCNRLA